MPLPYSMEHPSSGCSHLPVRALCISCRNLVTLQPRLAEPQLTPTGYSSPQGGPGLLSLLSQLFVVTGRGVSVRVLRLAGVC